jgi:hypothetical protein
MIQCEQQETVGDTGNSEADLIIGKLSANDVPVDVGVNAIAFIRRLVAEHCGPDGFATWKDAAVAERVRRVQLERFLETQALSASFQVWCDSRRGV